MQLGLTWPLQRLLRLKPEYGPPAERGACWDAHCITLHGRSSLLLVHCESRFTCVRFDMSPFDWNRLPELAKEEIEWALSEAGIPENSVKNYTFTLTDIQITRTHGRREVAFLNRAWEDVLELDWLTDPDSHRQPLLNRAVNARPCRCAGQDGLAPAAEHLKQYFAKKEVCRL